MSDDSLHLELDETTSPEFAAALEVARNASLSPGASLTRDMMVIAVDAALKSSAFDDVTTALADAGVSALVDLGLDIASDVAGIVPVVGAIVGVMIQVVGALGASSAEEQEARRRRCAASVKRPIFWHYVDKLPTDIFNGYYDAAVLARSQGADESMEFFSFGTLLGDTLIACLEHPYVDAPNLARAVCPDDTDYWQITARWKKEYSTWWGGLSQAQRDDSREYTEKLLNNVGIPLARRRDYQKLRLAIQSQLGKADGGQLLWAVYMDMLNEDAKALHWHAGHANYLLTHNANGSAHERVSSIACENIKLTGWTGTSSGTNATPQIEQLIHDYNIKMVEPKYDFQKAEMETRRAAMRAAIAAMDPPKTLKVLKLDATPKGRAAAKIIADCKARNVGKIPRPCPTYSEAMAIAGAQAQMTDAAPLPQVPRKAIVVPGSGSSSAVVVFGALAVAGGAYYLWSRK